MEDRGNVIRFCHFLNMLLSVLVIRTYFFLMDALPDKFPTKFAFNWDSYKWSGKGTLLVFVAMCIGLNIMMYIFIWSMPKLVNKPNSVNISNKEEFFKLPEEKRLPFLLC